MQIESLIRVLKKEPHVSWGVRCAQSGTLADCFSRKHGWFPQVITWDSCFLCATLKAREWFCGALSGYRTLELEVIFEIMEPGSGLEQR